MRWLLALAGVPALAAGSAADLAGGIRQMKLDPEECYRVRDLTLVKQDLRIYLTEGYLVFATPTAGRRTVAVFTATESEGGDAEVLLMPPTRGERRSLASYTNSPNLAEHITSAVLVFSDDSYADLTAQARARSSRKVPEMGLLLADKWNPVMGNIAASFETRLALDLLSSNPGFFAGAFSGRKLGNFDVLYDPRAREQIVVGQVAAARDNRAYFDVWTSFEARSFRQSGREVTPEFTLSDYRIEATVEPNLLLRVWGEVKVQPAEPLRALAFDLSRDMRVLGATVDGHDAEFLQRESMRANLVRNTGNDLVIIVPPAPLDPGRVYEVGFRAEGKVIHDAGNQVYFVSSRGNWYPNRWMQFATFDLTFRYPQNFDLVTPGQVVEEKIDGDWRITRRQTWVPIRLAGFNLGHYERVQASRAGYSVEVCANRSVESALQPRIPQYVLLPPPPAWPRNRRAEVVAVQPELAAPPNPRARLQELASDVAAALEFMSSRFGPPAMKHLTVSPVPGAFGQGFPGLLYLSTLSYLGRQDKPVAALDARQQLFFTEILQVHEAAHQWWGNVVMSSGYHDDWLMEALANYSALLYLEKRRGARTVDAVLDEYRANLLEKTGAGSTIDATGPIVLGSRLESSQTPQAWRHIIYGKGSWIMHMLRRQMGDERFLAMVAELRRRYESKAVSTEQFRQLAAKFLPPKSDDPDLSIFFDHWVYGTGIPELKLDYAVKGKARALRLTGRVTQSGVDENFSALAPIELQFGRGKQVHWVRTSHEPEDFSIPIRQQPTKVLLDPSRAVLRK
ncbi:MAG: M1 family metallopeptidase [Bryobacteraceae bacterium]